MGDTLLGSKRKYNFIPSCLSALFLLSIVIVHTYDSGVLVLFRYSVAIVCATYGLLSRKSLDSSIIIFSIFCFITGLCNFFIIGNMTIMGLAYCLMGPFIALVLADEATSPNYLLISFYLTVLIVLRGFLRNGFSEPVFYDVSNNYISVYLLSIITIYYAIVEKNNSEINLMHALICWSVCLIAQGRGGILAATILLSGLGLIYLKKSHPNSVTRILSYYILLVLIGGIIYLLLNSNTILNSTSLEHFRDKGMSSNGRGEIWGAYIRHALSCSKFAFFGAPISEIPIIVQFKGDVHNSFIAIHAFNGLLFCLYFIGSCISGGYNAIKSQRWIFLLCFITICLRGFTDKAYWGSSAGIPILLYYLFDNDYEKSNAKRNRNKKKASQITIQEDKND